MIISRRTVFLAVWSHGSNDEDTKNDLNPPKTPEKTNNKCHRREGPMYIRIPLLLGQSKYTRAGMGQGRRCCPLTEFHFASCIATQTQREAMTVFAAGVFCTRKPMPTLTWRSVDPSYVALKQDSIQDQDRT